METTSGTRVSAHKELASVPPLSPKRNNPGPVALRLQSKRVAALLTFSFDAALRF